MKSNEKINRKLGSYELYNWMRDKITSCNFCVYASIKGKITDETLRISLNTIQKRHPLLRVRIIKRGWWGASYTSKDVPEIPLQIVEAKKEEIFQYLESEQHTKFPSEKGPLMRCLLLRHGDKNLTLITNCCHTVSDGVSGIYIMRDIIN
ncbi:MAG: hypothetical protein GY870_20785, partial [archaeon]|nr:hypothetical protein [archaeon]